MIPVQTIVPRMLAEIVRKAPLTGEKVTFAWRAAVGPAIAAATEVVLDQDVLRVRARDRAWQRELERSAATVRRRLDDFLGAGVVRTLEFTAATAEPRRSRGSAEPARAPKTRPLADGLDTARRRR